MLEGRDVLLGAVRRVSRRNHTHVLPAGSTLVLHTDGLVESRSADIDEGLDRLLAAASSAGTSDPDALCDHLLSELTGAHRADDIALLVLTRR